MKRALLPTLGLIWLVASGACSGATVQPGLTDDGGGATSCAILRASATTLDFGTISVGQQSPPLLISVTNAGTCASAVLSTAVAGPDAATFIADNDGCKGQPLQPGLSCKISTHFAPTSSGAKTATLTVAGGSGESATVALTGTGAPITLLPTTEDFGTVVVGTSSVPATFTLTNQGSTPTGMIKMSVLGADQEQFVTQNDHCSGMALDPTKSCTVDVTFTAAGMGEKTAALTATIAGGSMVQSTLKGLVASGAAFAVTPPTYDFGSVTALTMSAPNSFVVKNIGQVATGVPMVAGSDPGCADFKITNDCMAGLPASGSCMFTVIYAPAAPTSSGETCNLNVTAPGTLASPPVKLLGVALTPAALKSNPPSKDFGPVLQGTTSADSTFIITNGGASTSSALTVSLSGTGANQFGIGSDKCSGVTLDGSATCTVTLHFSPNATSFGRVQAQLLVQGAVGGIASVGLSGTAATPASLAIGPTSHGFGTRELGTTSETITFTVTNSGTLASGGPTVTLSGSGDFVKGPDTCSNNPIPGNFGTCSVGVFYRPSGANFVTGMLTVSANPGGSVSATLNGTGATRPALQITGQGDYGMVTVHTTSGTTTFTVRNNGQTRSGGLQGASITGPNAGDFHVTGDGCNGQQLGPNGSSTCTVSVNFNPSNAAPESATLNENDGQGAAAGAGLKGTGIPACPTTCPAGDNCGTYTPSMAGCAQIACQPGCSGTDSCGGGGTPNKCGCTPNCSGKCGGPNGCGGTCPNTCTSPKACGADNVTCSCTPKCTGKCGGPDGCGTGGTCPNTCTSPKTCGADNVTCSCTPQCAGKCGGPDGCGTGGTCPNTCTSPKTCGADNVTCSCTPQCAGKCGGPDGCGTGGTCPNTCTSPKTCGADNVTCSCTPQCAGKCGGPDGCGTGGTCPNTCMSPKTCGADNVTCSCTPQCAGKCGGPDGCGTGGTCPNTCMSPKTCGADNVTCSCTPQCAGKCGGPDGCGTGGTCPNTCMSPNNTCGADNVTCSCTPQCAGKCGGPDGCGTGGTCPNTCTSPNDTCGADNVSCVCPGGAPPCGGMCCPAATPNCNPANICTP